MTISDDKKITRQNKGCLSVIWMVILNILLIILFVVGLIVGFSLLPIKNNYKILSVMSGSMEPSIPVGGLILIKPVETYGIGDVITFRSKKSSSDKDLTTHRISSEKQTDAGISFITKGDANSNEDTVSVDFDQILGKRHLTIPVLGYLLTYIKTLPGLMLIIIVPATVIIYEEARKIKHEARFIIQRRREKKDQNKKKDVDESNKKSKKPIKQE